MQDRNPIRTKIVTLTVLLLAAGAFFVASVSLGFVDAILWRYVIRASAAISGVVLLLLAVDRRVKFSFQKPEGSNVSDSQREFSGEAISAMRRAAADRDISADQARLFAMSIVTPASVRERLVETYEAKHSTLHQRSSLDLKVSSTIFKDSDSPKGHQYLPLLIPEKGELLDGLHVYDGEDRPIRTLPYREYLALMAAVLHTLVVAAQGDSAKPTETDVLLAERELLELIIRPSSALDTRDYERARSCLGDLARLSADQDLVVLLTSLVWTVITHYVVVACVELPDDGVARIDYEQVVLPSRVGRARRPLRVKRAFQSILGARPMFVSIPLSYAWTCESYHLQVKGPEGLYLAHQAVVLGNAKTPVASAVRTGPATSEQPQEPDDKPRKYLTFQRRLGQAYGHFYARSFPQSALDGRRKPEARFTFYETPPGTAFQATVAAISSFLLIWLIGYVVTKAPPAAGDDILGSDAPVLLLAFPGVAASWVGFETQPGLLSRSLSAVLSLIGTAAFSIAASALFMLRHGDVWADRLDKHFYQGFTLLGVDNACWGVLIALSLLNALMIGYRYIVRSRLYDRLASRPAIGVEDSSA